eukprot:6714179-Prymnesium_polylepis.3
MSRDRSSKSPRSDASSATAVACNAAWRTQITISQCNACRAKRPVRKRQRRCSRRGGGCPRGQAPFWVSPDHDSAYLLTRRAKWTPSTSCSG